MKAKRIDGILQQAISLGACSKSNGVTDWRTLVWLFFSPQGYEFCENNNFPTLEMFRDIKDEVMPHNVFVDAGTQKRINDTCVALIGDTKGELFFDDNTKIHKVILMHGASADIVIRNYAVVRLINMGDDSNIRIHRDKTSIVMK